MADAPSDPVGPDLEHGAPLADIPADGVLAGHLGGEPVLLSRSGDQVFAVSGACTHYGGPLPEGLVAGGKVHCPWHHACFDLSTGEALGAPAFAPLTRWRVEVVGGLAFVREAIASTGAAAPRDRSGDPRSIVIVGGGAAGFAASDMLRRLGFAGDLTILSADDRSPYDRPNLSKDYLAGTADPEWMPLRSDDDYAERNTRMALKDAVSRIDVAAHEVVTASGARFAYDALLLATGAEPVRLPTPGFDHPKVRLLRSMDDADAIIGLAEQGSRVVVVGASFIGLEAAASLRHRGLEVHVVAPESLPMEKTLGRDLAAYVRDLHEENGVAFHLERTPAGFDGEAVELDDGSRIAADFVVVGVGVRPRSGIAADAGLNVGNGVVVDARLQTSSPGIFAAGDVACYPDPRTGKPVRVEHWVVAERQGQVAAANMLGATTPFLDAPFFWSNHYDLAIHYVGLGAGWDRVEVDGDIGARDCTVRYFAGDRLVAAASVGRDLESLRLGESLRGEAASAP